jgi:hypothetical protein
MALTAPQESPGLRGHPRDHALSQAMPGAPGAHIHATALFSLGSPVVSAGQVDTWRICSGVRPARAAQAPGDGCDGAEGVAVLGSHPLSTILLCSPQGGVSLWNGGNTGHSCADCPPPAALEGRGVRFGFCP